MIKTFLSTFLFISATMAGDDTLHLCISEWPPHEYTDDKTKAITGSTVSLVQKTLDKMGKKYDIESLPFERCTALVKNGDKQGLFSLSKNPEREGEFAFSTTPLKAVGYNIAIKTEDLEKAGKVWLSTKNLKEFETALQKDIASPQGYSATKKAVEAGVKVDDSATDDDANFQKLMNNRVGAIIIEPGVFQDLKQKYGNTQLSLLETPLVDPKDYFVAFSKTGLDTAFIQTFSKTLEEVKKG